MGNCKCQNLNNQSEGEANFYNKQMNNSVNQLNVISNLNTQNKINREDILESTLEKSNPLGSYLPMSDYKKLVNEKTLNYIENHKINYQDYFPSSLNIYKSNPIRFKNGNIYHGYWNMDGEMEGHGIMLIKDKNVVTEGIWKKGNIIYGRIFFANNDIYEGHLQNSAPHGKGIIYFANKDIYKGDFVDGEMTGKGTFIYNDKSYYIGKVNKGIFNGEGSMKWNNGTEYHGNFKDSILTGKGKMFNNIMGEKYVGNFDRNEFNGNGAYTFKNGDIYEGNFEHGIKKGKGIYKRNDRVEFDVIWDDDLPNGKGVVIYDNNKINGFWRNGIIIRKEMLKGNMFVFNNIDLNLKPGKRSLCPSSLPHLNINDNETSQFVMGTEFSSEKPV